jgi:ATP-dependent exoDNAse (exonuclease V) beta subunit
VRSLLHTLRLVQDPSDHLAVVSALRSPLFGCSDVELYRWRRERGGSWTPTARLPPRLDGVDTVWDAMADLRRRIADRAWRTPSEQLESLVRDRRVLETALATPGRFDAWHRVRFVIEQARAWSDAGGRFLRDYLDWTARQTSLTGRIAEVPLDAADDADGTTFVDGPAPARLATESHTGAGVGADPAADVDDPDDAVRILTVHGAKGLEFPIAVVCGLSSRPAGRQRGVQVSWDAERGQIVRLRADLAQAGFDAHHAIDEQMDAHERSRLLYVACTRARDHLVVSIHRADTTGPTGAHALAEQITSSEHAAAMDGIEEALAAPVPAATGRAPTPIAPARHLVDLDRWRTDREALLGAAQRSRSVSATALAARALDDAGPNPPSPDAEADDDRFEELTGAAAPDDLEPGLAKRPVDLDLPAWRKGRYGTALGRAVHAVLQVVDLATGDGVDAAARAQAAAEGIEGEHELIAGLARSALAAPSVLAASKTDHWREVYVGIPVGDQVLEGYVDLLYRGPDGLVVVDHKTDRVDGDEDVAAKLAAYRLQLAAYALAVERATGETVSDARLVFCRPAQAREEPVIDLRAAMAEVEAALDAGAP